MKFTFDTDTGKFTVQGNAGHGDTAQAVVTAFTAAFDGMVSNALRETSKPAPKHNGPKPLKPIIQC